METEMDTERIAKLETKVESIQDDVKELKQDMKDIHSRITTQTREIVEKIDDFQTRIEHKMQAQAVASTTQHEAIQRAVQADIQEVAKTLDDDIKEVNKRVDILERWRYMIVGGAIVLGYIVGNLDPITKFFQ